MKTGILTALAALLCLGNAFAATPHVVLTCNIRVDLPADAEAGRGWASRKALCAEVIRARNPGIVCMQEVLRGQNEDMKKYFPEYAFHGFDGPEMDAHKEGYHGISKNVIMFSTKRYELVSAGGFWFSETPHLPGSMSWGTARARHANWVRLKERATGAEFRVINTHLDHKSQPSRLRQIKMIMEEAALYPADFPQIFAGDFNAHGGNPVYDIIRQSGWSDTYDAAHPAGYHGYTYHGFIGAAYAKKLTPEKLLRNLRIDYIFSRGSVTVAGASVIDDSKDGKYPSDHYFISAKVIINP